MEVVKLKGHEQQETEGMLRNHLQRRHAHDRVHQPWEDWTCEHTVRLAKFKT